MPAPCNKKRLLSGDSRRGCKRKMKATSVTLPSRKTMLSDYTLIICRSNLVVNNFFDESKGCADDLIACEVICVLEKTVIREGSEFFHTAGTNAFGNDCLIQIHETGEFKQRSASQLLLSFLSGNGRDARDKT